jgi:hypothetical protein
MKDKEVTTKSRDMEMGDAIAKVEKINKVEDLHGFCDGETRKDILDAIAKRLLRLRGGCTCEDVLENFRKKGFKV